ncbi:MAG: polysaccharide deacetylase family protein [Phenylobacterium sp.]|nr:polysaccharide deacetylase family protein [Phenylobacterium sp.]
MPLDPSYLTYERRRLGMDHDLYPASCILERPDFRWPDGRTVAIWPVVSLEWFPLTPEDAPFRAPGHMQTPYPDYRHYTARDYGLRVGAWRLLDAFERRNIRASFAINAAVAERAPDLAKAVLAGGHELIAHSTDMNGTIATGLEEAAERTLIADTLDRLERATGVRPRGWSSIARSQSWNTLRLLAAAGVDYQCDWPNDDLPYWMQTPAGRIANLPLNHELSDRQIITVQQHSAESYAEQIQDAFDWLARETGPRMLPLHLTPYILGLPFRIGAVESLLDTLQARPEAWFARGDEIFDAWRAAVPQPA